MNDSRRSFLKITLTATAMLAAGMSGLLKPLTAFARGDRTAFAAVTEAEALAAFFPDRQIDPSPAIEIGVHDVIENGAYVPVKVTTTLPEVSSITLLVEKNPNPLIASFNLSPECSGFIATRIKVGEPSDIIAVVESRGKLYSTRKFVEVIAGGCG